METLSPVLTKVHTLIESRNKCAITWLSGQRIHLQRRRHRTHKATWAFIKCGHEFDLWVGKIPWRRKWHPIPVFLPGKSHGQRSVVGYNPGVTELDTIEWLSTHTGLTNSTRTSEHQTIKRTYIILSKGKM